MLCCSGLGLVESAHKYVFKLNRLLHIHVHPQSKLIIPTSQREEGGQNNNNQQCLISYNSSSISQTLYSQ